MKKLILFLALAAAVFAQPVTNINMLRLGDGTVLLPSAAFQSDPDLGLRRVSANALGISATAINGSRSDGTFAWELSGSGSAVTLKASGATAMAFGTNDVERARFAVTTGNLLLGGLTTDDTVNILQVKKSGLAATSTSAVTVINDTAATGAVTVQASGSISLQGTAWDTAASQTLRFAVNLLPVSAATPTSTLRWQHSLNGAAVTTPMTLTSAGALTTLGDITGGGDIKTAAGGDYRFNGRSRIASATNGTLLFRNDGTSAGVTLDFATDAILKVRNQANNADAAITAGNVTINATSAITGVRTATATLDFGSILAAANADLTITVTGAAVNDVVVFGPPATMASGAIFNAWVTSADTVTVRCNNAGSIAIDPASATYRVTAISH